jgi:hypothetical protein
MGGCLGSDDFMMIFFEDTACHLPKTSVKSITQGFFAGKIMHYLPPFVEKKKQQTPSTKPKKTDI